MTLLAGFATGLVAVVLYQWWVALALTAVTSLLVLLVAPPGVATRLTFGVGFVAVVGSASVPRGEGDYLVASSTSGYLLLGLALLVLTLAVATLPRPRRHTERAPPRSPGQE